MTAPVRGSAGVRDHSTLPARKKMKRLSAASSQLRVVTLLRQAVSRERLTP
jgi:hypothetical protein